MALGAFHEHWRTRHAELITRLPGIRRYVQNYPLGDGAAYDAVAESSFDDTQAMKTLARTPEYAAVLADEKNFIDAASMGSIITEEYVVKNGTPPPGAVKRLAFVRRRPEVPVDQFFAELLEEGLRSAGRPGVCRLVQCHTRRAIYDSGRTPAYDGVTLTWFESADGGRGDGASLVATERIVI